MKRLVLAMAMALAAGVATAAERPNILLITADDLGCQLSCYGETGIRTPRLDELAASGIRFENAYVAQSSCSPSRAALLTGRWPHQNGQIGLAHLGFRMHPGQKTLPTMLKAAGYGTGIIGKLHVEPAADFAFDWMPAKKTAAGPTRDVKWVAEQSRAFFAAAAQTGKPFFYYVNFFDPHGPYTAGVNQVAGRPETPLRPADITSPMSFMAKTGAAQRAQSAMFLNCVRRLDEGVGLLMDEVRAAGLETNTLVLFIGDNGAPVRRGKTWSYEAGVRVPLMVRWPGVARAGGVRKELVSAIDVMPTVLAAAGVAVPAEVAGRPLQPLLGEGAGAWREVLFTEMNFHDACLYRPQRTVRDARWKLVLNLLPAPDQAAVELFDLREDPGEARSLADAPEHSGARKRLEEALRTWRERTGDPLMDEARRARWAETAAEWKASAPREKNTAYKNVGLVPEGGLKRLE